MSSSKKITLMTYDGETFEVEEVVAMESGTIKCMIDDDRTDGLGQISLSNVKGQTLSKVLEYCKKHVEDKDDAENLKAFDSNFMKMDQSTLYDLMIASNYLDIQKLIDLCIQTFIKMIKGKTTEQIRETFNIKNDFSPEEEEKIRNENPLIM